MDAYASAYNIAGSDDRRAQLMMTRYEGEVTIYGQTMMRRVAFRQHQDTPKRCAVRANYGVIRLMQSTLMASNKVSYTAQRGGHTKTLGEMELTQLRASGLSHCLEELANRSDTVVVDVCCSCSHIKILCECMHNVSPSTYKCVLPRQSVEFAITSRVCMNASMQVHPQIG